MSSKKDKFLESAQKFILKGQLDRAIKDYEQVVACDPNDIRHRQRLAELLVRANRKEEAIGEYEDIGKHYADNAYYLKAIAVYKQIQKLDPGNIKTSLNLASLNEKQGLTGNALAEYSSVYSHYDKSGKRADALSILEKMIAIDPENLNTRLKFAEIGFAAGNADKAYEDFVQIALLLRARGDESAFDQVCGRVRYLFSGKKDFLLGLVASQLKSGDTDAAIPVLREITHKEQGNLKAWQLLADVLRTTGENEELKVVLQKMVRLFPDELSPREGLIQCALDDGDTEGVLFLLKLHGALFLEKGAPESLERAYLSLLDRMPEETRLLQGLKNLYESSGAEAKLAGIVARLDSLSQEKVEEKAECQEEEIPPAEGAPVSAAELAEPGQETAWEDEIDISPPADGPVETIVTAMEPFPEERACKASGDETSPNGCGDPAEIALELELTEDELINLAELYDQAGTDEFVSLDAHAAVTDEPASEDFPQADPGLFSGELGLPGDECLELEAESFTEIGVEEAASSADHGKYSLDGLFSAFKKELDQQLDKEDTETHFNLGIAFKEMGLYDDAIAEFEAAAHDPRRKVDCIILQGACCRDKGDFARAEEIFRKGVALPGVTAEELPPLKYELALLLEAAGRKEDALHLYCEIHAVNPGFRDTAEKIAGLLGVDGQDYEDLDLVELDVEVE